MLVAEECASGSSFLAILFSSLRVPRAQVIPGTVPGTTV